MRAADTPRLDIPAPSSPRRTVAALVVGTDEWAIDQAASALDTAGHRTWRCHEPGEPAFPCNAFVPGRGCPLDSHVDVVITARSRPVANPTLMETGVTCGLHAKLPLVVAGVVAHNPFQDYATVEVAPGGDISAAAEQAADRPRLGTEVRLP